MLVDATLGLGGHTEAVLTGAPLARVVGIDRDPRRAGAGPRPAGVVRRPVHRACTRSTTSCPTSSRTSAWTRSTRCSSTSASPRCSSTCGERGFAYAEDAPLDMRMDATTGPTAADVLNTYSAAELTRVLREYGEERFARRIAGAVVRAPRAGAVHDVRARWSSCCTPRSPAPARRTGGHPAKRTFQALRMEVNDELAVLRRAIPAADRRDRGRRPGRRRCPTTRSRTGSSSGRSPRPPGRRSPGPAGRLPEGSEPALRLVTRAPSRRRRGRDRGEPTGRVGAAARRRAGQCQPPPDAA